jgi:hypothetical protein
MTPRKIGNIGYIADGQQFIWQQKWQHRGNGAATFSLEARPNCIVLVPPSPF